MSNNAELHGKILGFLAGEFARKDVRQCVSIDLVYRPGNGFRDEEIRKWVRADEPELFDVPNNFVNVEKLVSQIIEIAMSEADAKPPGKHCFVLRTHEHHGGRSTLAFPLSPGYSGSDETALVAGGGGGGGRQDASAVLMNHAGQLMRINAQMYEGTIRVLGSQNADMRAENAELRADNIKLRRENDELRSSSTEREFQIAMAMEKNARVNAGFQKLLQIGTVVAAKIGGGDEAQAGNSSLAMLLSEFYKSLRPDQMGVVMNTLDMGQKIMFMEIVKMVAPPEQPPGESSPGASKSTNGAPTP
jgi:hypothetical protein